MNGERWRRVQDVFEEAMARSAGARGVYLESACGGDTVLRDEVASLLAAHDRSGVTGELPSLWLRQFAGEEGPRFAAGEELAGRYRIVALLGRGGMGEVYRAEDLRLGQPVALKFLPLAFEHDPERVQRLLGEVSTARRVAHPNVCRVYDVVEMGDDRFVTMEYVDGEDLASLLGRSGRLPASRVADVARQLAAGLAAAHELGIVHRDLKPSNVMMDGHGRIRIGDFGLAAGVGEVGPADVGAGTRAYMAPEQRRGLEVTQRSDVYALGLVLYEVFTGHHPFEGSQGSGSPRASADRPANPCDVVEGFDPAVARVILHCLKRDPADRPASATEVLRALTGGDLLAATTVGTTLPTTRRRHRARWVASGLLAAAAVASIMFGMIGVSDRPSLVIVGSVDTPGKAYDVAVAGSHAYVADGEAGLQVVDISDPASPRIVGSVDTPGEAPAVAVAGTHAYVADGEAGLQVMDISDPALPRIVGSVDTPGSASAVDVVGDHAYVADSGYGLQVVDISNPNAAAIVGSVDTPGTAAGVAVLGSHACVTDWATGLQVVDISNPASPAIVGNVDTPLNAGDIAVAGTHAYVTDGSGLLLVVDISNPTSPAVIGSINSQGWDVAVAGRYAYVPVRAVGLQVVDISDPASPSMVGAVDTPGTALGVAVAGDHVYVADGVAGLQVLGRRGRASSPRNRAVAR